MVVPLVQREVVPQRWNIWDLEHIAAEAEGSDPARDEELGLLLMNLRPFADASGELSVDFDPLVRETFGDALAELPAQRHG